VQAAQWTKAPIWNPSQDAIESIRERVTTNLKDRAPAIATEVLPTRDDKKLQVGPEL
jgi:hypothetical protein